MTTPALPYVDGFVVPVPKDKLEAYLEAASTCAKIWKEHGALEYYECAGDDLEVAEQRPFSATVEAGPDETVFFSFVIYPSREVRDEVNKKIMDDPRMKEMCETIGSVFDCKRMAYGGFKTLVKA